MVIEHLNQDRRSYALSRMQRSGTKQYNSSNYKLSSTTFSYVSKINENYNACVINKFASFSHEKVAVFTKSFCVLFALTGATVATSPTRLTDAFFVYFIKLSSTRTVSRAGTVSLGTGWANPSSVTPALALDADAVLWARGIDAVDWKIWTIIQLCDCNQQRFLNNMLKTSPSSHEFPVYPASHSHSPSSPQRPWPPQLGSKHWSDLVPQSTPFHPE